MKRKHCIDRYYLYYTDVIRFSYKWNENIALIDIICTTLMLYAFLNKWNENIALIDIICTILMLYAFLINETKTLHWYILFVLFWCCTLFLKMKRKHCIDRYYLYYTDVVRFSYKWNPNIALIDIICTILMLSAFLINETTTLHW